MGETGCDIWGKWGVSANENKRYLVHGRRIGAVVGEPRAHLEWLGRVDRATPRPERARTVLDVGLAGAPKEFISDKWGRRGATCGETGCDVWGNGGSLELHVKKKIHF